MTVSTTTSRADYTGNGTTTAFTVPFYFLDNSHLTVLRTQVSTGVITTLAITTDYTVSGAGNPAGGTITCLVAPTTDQKISVLRNVPFTQLNTYVPNDPFPAASHERALDQLTMEVQQLDEAQDRALSLPANTPAGTVSAELPTPQANKFIGWNSTATGLQNLDASTLASVTAFATAYSDVFSGNGTQTNFTLSSHPGSLGNLRVSISGVMQRPTIDYTWSSGTTLTFTSAPASGTNNVLVQYATATPGPLGIGTIATQDANNVSISGGSITGITDLAIADGGTGASNATDARTNLGLSDGANLNFTQAGTGAVTRSIDARLKDWISVKDFGVVADGTDQTTKIQAAIDAASAAGGGVLYFPPGTYTIASSINLKSNVVLNGGNRKATLSMTHTNTDPRNTSGQRYGTNTVGVMISGEVAGGFTPLDNTGIIGFRITHASPSGGKALSAITARNVTNLVVSNNEIFGFNCMVTGIRLASIIGGEIKDNIIRDCVLSDGLSGYIETYTGITGTTVPASGTLSLAATLGAPVLARVQASGSAFRPSRSFTYNAGTQNITLGSAATATDTIYVQYGLAQSNGIEVDNDRVNSIGSEQLLICGNRVADVKFTGTAYNNWLMETDGIQLAGSVARCTISDNVVHDVGEGIDTFSKYCTFNGNQVSNCGLYGIKLTHGASFNTITNTSVDGAGLAGLVIAGSSVNLTPCDGNVVSNISIQRLNYNTTFSAGDCAAVAYSEESATYTVSNTVLADVSADCGANAQYGLRNTTTSGNNNHSGLRIKGTHASFAPGTSLSFASNSGRNYTVNLAPGSPIITMRFDDNALLEQVTNVNNGLSASASAGSPQGIRYKTLLGTASAQNIDAYRMNVTAVADWGTGANRNTRLETATSVAGSLLVRSVTNETGTSFGGATAAGDPDAVLTVNGVASFGDGTAAAPSVAHRGDLDTGIYFPSAGNAVGIATNGAARVYVDTNGLGINTTSFSTDKLRVQGGASARYFGVNTDGKAEQRWNDNSTITDGFTLANNGVSASNQGIGLRFNLDTSNGAGNESAYIRALSSDTYAAAANRSAVLTIGTINANTLAERMRIDNAGNVGIATTAPDTRVHAVNTSAGAATYAAFLQNASSTQNTEIRLAFAANALALNTGGGRHGYIAGVNTSVGGTATDFVFAPNANGGSGTERFRIASDGTLTIADAGNLAVGSTTGTKIGTATTQKLAFYNATPIVQRAAAAQAAVATTAATQTTPWGFSTQAQADGIITLLNEIRTTLVNLGLMKGSA